MEVEMECEKAIGIGKDNFLAFSFSWVSGAHLDGERMIRFASLFPGVHQNTGNRDAFIFLL